jgi:hypothetical protein
MLILAAAAAAGCIMSFMNTWARNRVPQWLVAMSVLCVHSKRSLITDIILRNKKQRLGIETREVNPATYIGIVLGKRVISVT